MDMRKAIIAQTSFSLRLSSHLLSFSNNLAFSPLSLHSLLGLLAAGSSGPTHDQLLSFLGSPVASELAALHSQISNVILADGSAAGGPCLCYAGGVWVDASRNLKNSFREVAGSVYKAEAHSVPFRSMELSLTSFVYGQ
ncbi:Serpin family protein [Rhynchospora pubera]|uniref:Serpin family protein n=1 Tax=Rhynchospora pubera TaxID=906938 RepID=A0AAV8CG32_9POAL|nr:Serpin family protein [Rhynchospora pubera]